MAAVHGLMTLPGSRTCRGWMIVSTASIRQTNNRRGPTDNTNYTRASGVQYNPANQITNATFPSAPRHGCTKP